MAWRSGLTLILSIAALLATHAQTPTTPSTTTALAFKVASLKVDKSGDDRAYASVYPGGRYSATNVSLKGLVLASYHVDLNRVVGGPSWFDTDHFDVEAKAPDGTNPTQEQLDSMLKALLADRFQLRAHEESRPLPVYALEKAATPSKLKPSSGNCVNPGAPPDKGPRPSVGANGQPFCGHVMFSPMGWSARSVTTEQIAKALEPFAGRVVLDRTKMSGSFDVDLEFNPRFLASPANEAGISVFTAVQEQLGFKLESTTAPAKMLVIDHAEKPTAD